MYNPHYFSGDQQLQLLVHALYQALPDDVIILPRDCQDKTKALASALKAIVDEVTSASQAMKKIIKEAESTVPVLPMETGESSEMMASSSTQDSHDVGKVRKEFESKKRQLFRESNKDEIDMNEYDKFLSDLVEKSKKTDIAMQAL